MAAIAMGSRLSEKVFDFIRRDFHQHFWDLDRNFGSHDSWKKLSSLGTELWLDSGDIEGIEPLWTQEFCALTTNNTLLNKEVQKGIYDEFILDAYRLLLEADDLDDAEKRLELSFILNAHHGLKLVEKFDAYVSVELHTDLANDIAGTVAVAKRLYEICPERFIIKVPFTPSGLIATRILSQQGIPVNHTLGFSARMNYVAAVIGRPEYVNVFASRLNRFVKDNWLGDGDLVGAKATLASQAVISDIRKRYDLPCRQIGASLQSADDIFDLAGIDVMTIPLKAAHDFLDMPVTLTKLEDKLYNHYKVGIEDNATTVDVGFDVLWDIDRWVVGCVEALDHYNVESFSSDDLLTFFDEHGCGDLLVRWTPEQTLVSMNEGKIPEFFHWKLELANGEIGLDALMNLAGLNSFTVDQRHMDRHVERVLEKADVFGLA